MSLPLLRLGLCCINDELRHLKPKKDQVYCSRTVQLKNYSPQKAESLALQNCVDLGKLIAWNEEVAPTLPQFHGIPIRVMRVSSDIWPQWSNTKIDDCRYDVERKVRDALQSAGAYAREKGHRLLMHPGQYNQVGTPTRSVFEATCRELAYQARVLDMLGVSEEDGVLIVHGGGTYKDKEATKKRWIEQFFQLPKKVQGRLVLENDERQYGVEDVLEICKAIGRPMIYDSHHHRCYQLNHPDYEPSFSMMDIVETWVRVDPDTGARHQMRPVMHVSEQRSDARVGAHSDFICEGIPPEILELCKQGVGIDLEVEAKKKEKAIARILDDCAREQHPLRHLFLPTKPIDNIVKNDYKFQSTVLQLQVEKECQTLHAQIEQDFVATLNVSKLVGVGCKRAPSREAYDTFKNLSDASAEQPFKKVCKQDICASKL